MPLIKKLPIPASGLMLALATAGNLFSSYGIIYKYAFGAVGAVLLVLLTVKAVTDSKSVAEGFENPVIASVMPTYSMGLMIFSTYVKAISPSLAFGVWGLGLLLHAVLLICFTRKYILGFDMKKVFPSYFVVYVGIVCGSIAAPALGLAAAGRYIFWFGFAAYILLLPVVLYRVVAVKGIPEPAQPTVVILAAPPSLCLAGYLSAFPDKSIKMVAFLGILLLLMLAYVLLQMPRLLKLKFYPSYSAFTFPFAITAVAVKNTMGFLGKSGFDTAISKYPLLLLEIWSAIVVIYVLVRYAAFLTAGFRSGSAGTDVKA